MFTKGLRVIIILFSFISFNHFLWAQSHVNLTINFSGIDKEKLFIDFDDGTDLNTIDLQKGDSSIQINKPVYTPYPRISMYYDQKFSNIFFIKDTVAILNLYYEENDSNSSFYSDNNVNISEDIYDTVFNKRYHDLRKDQMKEQLKLRNLLQNHGHEIQNNDSIKYELSNIIKDLNAKSMDFLAPYANEFFSFYYFKAQILLPSSNFIGNDPEYYSTLLEYYNTVFPEEFKNTGEGKKIASDIQKKITPVFLKEGESMPETNFKDIYGNDISFKNQGEGYILLDFWASWCPPCIRQIPDLKKLKDEFSEDRLKIIGISIDSDSSSFINSVNEHSMDWLHSWDRGGLESSKLEINSIPRIVILDKNAKIVYYRPRENLNLDTIRAIIEGN